jgi:hypothetical protein
MGDREGPPEDEAQLMLALGALLAADDAGAPLDNESLAKTLGWDLARTGSCLLTAKARAFIWASRSGSAQAAWFSDIEVTMQGRRFLRTNS